MNNRASLLKLSHFRAPKAVKMDKFSKFRTKIGSLTMDAKLFKTKIRRKYFATWGIRSAALPNNHDRLQTFICIAKALLNIALSAIICVDPFVLPQQMTGKTDLSMMDLGQV